MYIIRLDGEGAQEGYLCLSVIKKKDMAAFLREGTQRDSLRKLDIVKKWLRVNRPKPRQRQRV